MAGQPIAADTPPEIESLQRDIWRKMTLETKGRIVTGLCQGVREAALAGIRRRHPGAGPREQFLRLALLYLGPELTVEAFPDAATLLVEAPGS